MAGRLSRLRIFYTVPLGIVEAFRMYGISKCRHEWVLNLVTDERLSPALKRDIRKIISNTDCDGFSITRHERVYKNREDSGVYSLQTRLSRKGKTLYRGILHEQPIISGRTCKLDGRMYFLEHREDMGQKSGSEYNKILKFERLSYNMYNRRMADYISRLVLPDWVKAALTWAVGTSLKMYEKLTLRDLEAEIGSLDYFVYHSAKYSGSVLQGHLGTVFGLPSAAWAWTKAVSEARKRPDSGDTFEAAKIMDRIGMIRFMELDKESTMRALNRKYMDRRGGIDLLIELIMEKYEKSYKHGRRPASA